jgi:glutathione peroxidase
LNKLSKTGKTDVNPLFSRRFDRQAVTAGCGLPRGVSRSAGSIFHEEIGLMLSRRLFTTLVLLGVGLMSAVDGLCHEPTGSTSDEKSIYDFKVKTIDGKEVDLSEYKGKTILIVNVASKCGYTRQYSDMQTAFEKYKDRGLVILGFPCNQFGGQEPGSEAEIMEFCKTNYGVTFPMFAKLDVKGEGADPLFKYLSGLKVEPKGAGDISWNFEKFLISSEGKVIGRYKSAVSPTGKDMVQILEDLLPKSTGAKG